MHDILSIDTNYYYYYYYFVPNQKIALFYVLMY